LSPKLQLRKRGRRLNIPTAGGESCDRRLEFRISRAPPDFPGPRDQRFLIDRARTGVRCCFRQRDGCLTMVSGMQIDRWLFLCSAPPGASGRFEAGASQTLAFPSWSLGTRTKE